MRVRAVISFVSVYGGRTWRLTPGDEVEMPAGADWLRSGLVQVVEDGEKAVLAEPRTPGPAQPVTAIDGIGPKTAAALKDLGIETVPQLAAAEDLPEELARFKKMAQAFLR